MVRLTLHEADVAVGMKLPKYVGVSMKKHERAMSVGKPVRLTDGANAYVTIDKFAARIEGLAVHIEHFDAFDLLPQNIDRRRLGQALSFFQQRTHEHNIRRFRRTKLIRHF